MPVFLQKEKTSDQNRYAHIIGFLLSVPFLFFPDDSKFLPTTSIQVVHRVKTPLSRMPTSIFRKWRDELSSKIWGRDECGFGVRDERVAGSSPWMKFTIMLHLYHLLVYNVLYSLQQWRYYMKCYKYVVSFNLNI